MSNQKCSIEDQRQKSGFQFFEDIAPGLVLSMDMKNILVTTQSEFQKIDVIESHFGKHLVTDGKTQSTQFDEKSYHESLVHPALFQSACLTADFGDEKKDESNGASRFFGAPKSVFIGGGGELATAREVLRHKSVSRVVMVDLDGDLVNICREYLPEWGGETVMSDPRFELVIGDCYEYLLNCTEKFDAIIMDISDPIEAGPGIMLYTQELYSHAKSLLTENGVFVTQAGAADAIPAQKDLEGTSETCCFGPIANTLATVFNCVLPYTVCIPSYGSDWGFVMAFNSPDPFSSMCEMMNMPINQIDNMISSRIAPTNHISNSNDKDDSELLEHYDGIAHHRMFSLPKKIRKCLDNEKRIMTKDNPVFMY